MAEALAIISLVGNIVQFISVGIKVTSDAHEIYKTGSLESNAEVAQATGRLKGALDLLQNGPMVERDKELSELVLDCSKLADEVNTILKGLKPNRRKNQLFEATSKSLKTVKARGRIKNVERKLDKMKNDACFRLNVLLRFIFLESLCARKLITHSSYQVELLPSIKETSDLTRIFYNETRDRMDNMTIELQNMVESPDLEHVNAVDFFEIANKLTKFVDEVKDSDKICKILQSLYFKQMKQRQSDVAVAHRDTFEWIFEHETDVNFMDWLQASNGIYWVSGKAGSGKSTLMKFILHHSRTEELLGKWAWPNDPVIASHFFWSAGTRMQKSQEGLFKTLLLQVLAGCPEIISQVCPRRWSDSWFSIVEPWTRAELFETFKAISTMPKLPKRICLFIDGLDEYKGDHAELVDMLHIISQCVDIKICASSRPWQVFQDAFESSQLKLYVHDLTKDDIKLYIGDNLGCNARFQVLKQKNPEEAAFFIEQIQMKAQGVFLWVYLVVRSLLRGLLNRDELSDLRRRLNELPGELEDYFKLMLDTIEPVYQEQSARVFKIMVCAGATLPIVMFHFIDKERNDGDYALRQEFRPLPPADIAIIVDEKKRQLNARCRDLLHFTVSDRENRLCRERVGFLHRTDIDFLQTGDMDSMLSSRCTSGFEPCSSLCKAHLATLKAWDRESTEIIPLSSMVYGSIFYAKEASEQYGSTNAKVLEELEPAFSAVLECSTSQFWNSLFWGYHFDNFLPLAVRLGLAHYVTEKMSCPEDNGIETLTEAKAQPGYLLGHALRRGLVIEKETDFWVRTDDEIDLSMVRLLLKSGADPLYKLKAGRDDELLSYNESDSGLTKQTSSTKEQTHMEELKGFDQGDRTVWARFLFQLQVDYYSRSQRKHEWDMTRHLEESTAPYRSLPASIFESCQLMIEHGAPRKYHKTNNTLTGDHFLDAEDVFVELFPSSQSTSLIRLLRQHEPLRKQTRKGRCTVM